MSSVDLGQQKIGDHPKMRWLTGDVRDQDRLTRTFYGVAAMKQVDSRERWSFEFIASNMMGAENLIDRAIDAGAKRFVALSEDMASSPINLACKCCGCSPVGAGPCG